MPNGIVEYLGPALFVGICLISAPAGAAEPPDGTMDTHALAASVATDDVVLKEQIAKVDQAIQELHGRMVERRQAIQQVTDKTKKAALDAELDGLRKERDMLERLLHELVEEARATEWTAVDQALARAKSLERRQEEAYQRQEALRDRQN